MSIKYSELADFIKIDVIHYMFTNMDKHVLIVCPNKKMKKQIFDDIFLGFSQLQFHDYIKRHTCTSQPNEAEIELLNGSVLNIISDSWGIKGRCTNRVHIVEKQNFPKELLDDVICSLYPVISASKDNKIFGI